ncbi:MAG: outer membrane protein assembly factor BamD [Candidatus Omnitrophota bacterium]
MRYRLLIILIILLVTLASDLGQSYAYWIWTPQSKRWMNPRYAPKDTPAEQLLYALDLFQAEEYRKALEEFKKVVSFYRKSESAAEAQYYIGLCHEKLENLYQAFLGYQAVVDNYPFSRRIDEVIKREYDIGEKLFQGDKVKFVGMKVKATPEQIIEIFNKVVSNAPYSENAPMAQYRIGELYKQLQFYKEAIDAFQKVVTDYPDSKMASEASFQVAICASSGSLGSSYDQQLTNEAIVKFEEFSKQHPDSEFVKEAQKEKKVLREKQAASLYEAALFYERAKKYSSAMIYYEDIVDNFSDTPTAISAMEKLEILKRKLK